MSRKELSQILNETVGRGIVEVKQFALQKDFVAGNRGKEILIGNSSPCYVSQIADADPRKIEKFYGKIDDLEAARRFGTDDLDEFSYWAWRSCGICGVQMVLETELGKDFRKKIMDLVNEGLELGGYDVSTDVGWYHNSLVELARHYGLTAQTHKLVPSIEIALEIQKRNYVLASIKSEHGGHLLLVYGYKVGEKGELAGFLVHDPDNYQSTGEAKFINLKEYENLANFRTITFQKRLPW